MSENIEAAPSSHSKVDTKRNILNDLTSVGPEKPLGYLSFGHITQFGQTPENLAIEAERRGLSHQVTTDQGPEGPVKFLYFYDPISLQELLDKKKTILEAANWPTSSKEFVDYSSNNKAPQETDLFDVVADAFADYTNPGRKTYPRPLTTKQKIGIILTKFIGSSQFARNRRDFNRKLQERRPSKS